MSQAPEAGITDPGERERPGLPVSARTLRIVSAVLALLLVLAVVAIGLFLVKVKADRDADKERAAASSVAAQFALRMDKVDSADFEGYVKNVNQLLTTKAKAKNTKVFDTMKDSYQAAKVKGDGKVLLTGVGDFDSDSATVLVAHDASVSTTQGDIEHHYRWSVSLVKVKDAWLVDDFNPVS